MSNEKDLNSNNKMDKKSILYSNKFWVFNKLITMPKKFRKLIKVDQNHRTFPHKNNHKKEVKLIISFLKWLEKQLIEKPILFQNKTNCV